MSGFDPEAIFDAIAARFSPETFGVNVHAFAPAAPVFPAMALFPVVGDFVDYWGTFGDNRAGTLNLEIRTAFTFEYESSMRQLFRLIASGPSHPQSIIDRLRQDPQLGGLVDDIFPRAAFIRLAGEENAGLFEAVIPVMVLMRREG